MSASDDETATAYHEAGHAFTAAYAGGRVLSVSIAPDNDDGPHRYGDTQVAWRRAAFAPLVLAEKLVLVALGGPVAEMIYTGEPFHPALVAEWSADWQHAWSEAAALRPEERPRTVWLEARTAGLHGLLSDDRHWEAIAGVADHLLAHETLDEEMFAEVVSAWLG
ncbi:hypothetical protein [Botrimarina hoheduenensis]|uniref:ATP-dependent zinc metalloprotease FtsH n=1 Tax=Botrimarina hoheduenensis TaxID=2528000 RepID=A0A5C5WAA1_9BACT|nr:hypothetical protein [Botrimarina hoheduenensis]TWT47816.1 hypothetical protein Pla111_14390 [Botrimarina hoheduenensis]